MYGDDGGVVWRLFVDKEVYLWREMVQSEIKMERYKDQLVILLYEIIHDGKTSCWGSFMAMEYEMSEVISTELEVECGMMDVQKESFSGWEYCMRALQMWMYCNMMIND